MTGLVDGVTPGGSSLRPLPLLRLPPGSHTPGWLRAPKKFALLLCSSSDNSNNDFASC